MTALDRTQLESVVGDALADYVAEVGGLSYDDGAAVARFIAGRIASAERVVTHQHSTELPPMQRAVLDGVVRGLTNAQIAQELGRSPFTVSNHLKEIFRRYGVHSRTMLVVRAREGMLA